MQGVILRIMDKFFCLHEWTTHAKKETTWETEQKGMAPNTIRMIRHEQTTEILVCEGCGKIKKLEY